MDFKEKSFCKMEMKHKRDNPRKPGVGTIFILAGIILDSVRMAAIQDSFPASLHLQWLLKAQPPKMGR